MDAKVMSTMKRFAITVTTVAAVMALAGTGPTAHAQDVAVQGPLAGAPAVIGLRIYREMRLQIQIQSTMTLQDEFSRTFLFGGQVMFHPTDWLGFGVWGGFAAVNMDTNLTEQVMSKGQPTSLNVLSLPKPGAFAQQIGHIKWIAAPQISFIPLRGKLGLFEKLFIDADFYAFGGVGFIGLEERADVERAAALQVCGVTNTSGANLSGAINCLAPTQSARASRTAIAPTFGVGLSLYMTNYLAMTIEWRALPFAWNTSGTDESGNARGNFPDFKIDSQDRLMHFNHMISLGLAFYLPTEPKLSTAGTE